MKNKIHSLDDEQLIALCRIGDDEAYSVLVARYLFTVRNRASVYNNSGIDFEDLVQEGFIGLLNAVKCYESNFDTSFSTFAYLCIDRNFTWNSRLYLIILYFKILDLGYSLPHLQNLR